MPGAVAVRGDDVTLRTVERDDAALLQRAYSDPDVRVPLGSGVKSESEMAEFVQNRVEGDGRDSFVVCLDGDDAPPGSPGDGDDVTAVGALDVLGVDRDRPALSYWILPEHQGEGYGTAAVRLAVNYTFRTYSAHGVGAHVYDFNEASRALLESLGFVEEGRAREKRFIDGEYRDTVHYSLLRREWREQF